MTHLLLLPVFLHYLWSRCDQLKFRQLTFRHLEVGQVNPTITIKWGYISILRIAVSKGMRLRRCLHILSWMHAFCFNETLKFYLLLG